MNRKYPFWMFLVGVVLNFLFHYLYLSLPGVILCLIGIRSKTALSLGLAMLTLDLILSIAEQIRIRKTILSESDNPEFNQLMDTFYGNDDGESFEALMEQTRQEEEAQQRQDQAVLERLVVYRTLRDSIHDGMSLADMVTAFENMCAIDLGEPDNLLFETGIYNFTGEKRFYFNLVRQFQFLDDEEYVQLHLDVMYDPSAKPFGLPRVHWGEPADGEFFNVVRSSREYRAVIDQPIIAVDIRVERT